MARQTLVTRPRKLTVSLPGELGVRLDLYLMSTSQGRIPYGAHQRFLVERITEFFDKLKQPAEVSVEVAEALLQLDPEKGATDV